MSTKTPTDLCPKCGYAMDRATPTSHQFVGPERQVLVPKPGDFSVCISCGAVLQFDRDMHVRGFERNDEWRGILLLAKQHDAIVTIVRAQRAIWARGPLPNRSKANA